MSSILDTGWQLADRHSTSAVNGGPRLGDMTAGMTAAAWGASTSVVVGGLAAVLGVCGYAIAVPQLTRYTSTDGIDPIGEREHR